MLTQRVELLGAPVSAGHCWRVQGDFEHFVNTCSGATRGEETAGRLLSEHNGSSRRAIAVRLTSLEIRTATPNACHASLRIRCPPKAIRITPPGPSGESPIARTRKDAEGNLRSTCSAAFFCGLAGSLSEEAIFLQKEITALRPDAERNDLRQGKTPRAGRREPRHPEVEEQPRQAEDRKPSREAIDQNENA